MSLDESWMDEGFEEEATAPDATSEAPEAEPESAPEAKQDAEGDAKAEPEDATETAQEATAETPEQSDEQTTQEHTVPLSVLTSTRDEMKQRYAELEAKYKALESSKSKQKAEEKPKIPDPLDDPDGHASYIEQRLEQQTLNAQLNVSERFARKEHGDDVVDGVIKWVTEQAESNPYVVEQIRTQRDPYDYAIKLYKREQLVQEIGDDPDAFKQKAIAEYLASQQEAAGQSGQAAPTAKKAPPKSLAKGGAGQTEESEDLSDEGIFNAVFKR